MNRIIGWRPAVWAWLVAWLTTLADGWRTDARVARRRVGLAWKVLCGEAHHGGALLLPGEDSLRGQARLAQALGGMDRALIIQKMHEWIEYNRKNAGVASTYNGYSEWCQGHFGWLSEAAMGRHVRALEALGVLSASQTGRADRRKTYRINYPALRALVNGARDQCAKSNDGRVKAKPQRAKSNDGATKAKVQGAPAHDLPIDNQEKTQEKTQEANQPDTSVVDGGDAVYHDLKRLGLTGKAAAALMQQYGADRVRAVVRECERRRADIRNAPGWVRAELKNDVFGLGERGLTTVNPYDLDAWLQEYERTEVERVRRYL